MFLEYLTDGSRFLLYLSRLAHKGQVDVEKLTHELVLELHNQFVNEKGDLPLNFVLYDGTGHRVKMFSRTCKIGRSRELYEYFENNDAIKMKIN